MTALLEGLEDQVQRELAQPPRASVAPGLALTLWHSDGIDRAWEGAQELLAQARPDVVQLHCWPTVTADRIADRVQALLPGVRLWIGAGIDGVARQVRSGRWSVSRGARELADIARGARDLGAELLVLNAEGAWKTPPGTPERVQLEALVTAGLAGCVAAAPGLTLGHTSYDHPSYHGDYPWRAWLCPGSPVAVALPQVYAAPDGGLMAHRGALPAREARALASWAAAIRAGWIEGDDPGTPALEGPLWAPYLQGHHVTTEDSARALVEHPLACLWAAPSRLDDAGRLALLAACELRRRGFRGPGAVQAFQLGAGLVTDGVVGPQTLAGLGVGS